MTPNLPQSARIVFNKPGKAEIEYTPLQPLQPGDVLMETEYSIVSPGTELACLSGKEPWAPLPFGPGYGSVGRVVEMGGDIKGLQPGQRIFTYGPHARIAKTSLLTIPIGEVDPIKATFARMAAVSITALRVSDAMLGDTVAVFGLGLVGNLAAQLFCLAGCRVIGIDPSPTRRRMALECGVNNAVEPGRDLREQISDLSGGEMCRTVVEATGSAAVAVQAPEVAGKLADLVLLGSPRAKYETDITPFLGRIFSWSESCVTVKGAHEWRFPVHQDKDGHGRHSMERNLRCLLGLIEEDKLKIAPLITQVVSPMECQTVYEGLRDRKDEYCGVVFDWSKI